MENEGYYKSIDELSKNSLCTSMYVNEALIIMDINSDYSSVPSIPD